MLIAGPMRPPRRARLASEEVIEIAPFATRRAHHDRWALRGASSLVLLAAFVGSAPRDEASEPGTSVRLRAEIAAAHRGPPAWVAGTDTLVPPPVEEPTASRDHARARSPKR